MKSSDKSDDISRNRRLLVKLGVASAAGLPLAAGLVATAKAEALPRLEESDLTAVALGYVHDASILESSVRGADDHICSSCTLYTGGTEEWGPCAIFPGKSVAAKGWCRSWVAKA